MYPMQCSSWGGPKGNLSVFSVLSASTHAAYSGLKWVYVPSIERAAVIV